MMLVMIKWELVCHRTMQQQLCLLRNSSSGLYIALRSYQQRGVGQGGRREMVNATHIGGPSLGFSSQPTSILQNWAYKT
jgi:hypothetical protein